MFGSFEREESREKESSGEESRGEWLSSTLFEWIPVMFTLTMLILLTTIIHHVGLMLHSPSKSLQFGELKMRD